ncbi:hypothetical protein ABW19_dt0206737 [Dactylella cylindrospora]|nr:hypothetical protein ABW19_dt0206737 [Dactylella cylindrospora]
MFLVIGSILRFGDRFLNIWHGRPAKLWLYTPLSSNTESGTFEEKFEKPDERNEKLEGSGRELLQ